MENARLTTQIVRQCADGNAVTTLDDADVLASLGWVSHDDAMSALGLSRATMQRLRSSGRLPYAKLGRRVFYRAHDLAALLAAASLEAAPPRSSWRGP